MSSLTDRLQVPPAGEAPGVRPPARTLGATTLPRVSMRRLSRGTWRVSYLARSGNEYVIGCYQNHATAQHQARAYARVQDCPVEEVGA